MISHVIQRVLFITCLPFLSSANEIKILSGHKILTDHHSPLPIDYIDPSSLPSSFNWANVNGTSYLTHVLNQHIPQYCGSCWAHGSLSALADRIKIARGAIGTDINLSIQFILNCGGDVAGSCYGGSGSGTYEFIKSTGYVPYDTCNPYLACSSDSTEGFCRHVDTSCEAVNICRTCDTFSSMGGTCSEIDYFPNTTVAEYGHYSNDVDAIMAEIYARGPVAAQINADPLRDFHGGIFSDVTASIYPDHIVSIVGWGFDESSMTKYWIVRNSWGHYWGELGFFRVEMGKNILGIEGWVDWAIPGEFTVDNFRCDEDGKNCISGKQVYLDPSTHVDAMQRRLQADN